MPSTGTARHLLTELYWAAVRAAAPGPALRAGLVRHAPHPDRPVHLLALGKAALPMAQAAVAHLASLGLAPAGGLLVLPEPGPSPHPLLEVAVGDHPEPGPGSLAAAAALGRAVAAVGPEAEAWVLLSGGTTSLIGAPVAGLQSPDLTALYRLLLGSGLDITAMNRIRKRFTRWSAGRLTTALYPAHVKSFTISDVIGDDLGSIGSGPCVPDGSNAEEVRTALTSTGLWERLPAALKTHLEQVMAGALPETPKANDPAFTKTTIHLVASNRLALEAAAARARELGLTAEILDAALAGEAAQAGRHLAARLRDYDATQNAGAQDSQLNKDTICIWGGETTVTLPPDAGPGGRSQELALAAAEVFADAAPGPELCLLAAGTDGRDGPTDAAGGFADRATWGAIRAAGRDPRRDLATHNAFDALEAGGALFRTGMTGTNVMDLVLGYRARDG